MTLPIETGIRSYALGSPAITAIIADRWGPHAQTQLTQRPYVVYSRISADHQRHLRAASGLVFARLQLDLYGDSFPVLLALAEAIRNRIDGFYGVITLGSDTLDVRNVEIVDEQTGYETPNDGTDQGPHRYRIDIRISALEPVPTLT